MKKFTILPRSIENANDVEGVKNISMRFELGTSDDALESTFHVPSSKLDS